MVKNKTYHIDDIAEDIHSFEGIKFGFSNYLELKHIKFESLYSDMWVKPVKEMNNGKALSLNEIVNIVSLRIVVFFRDIHKVTVH